MSGEYTCMAYNYVTENSSSNSKMLTVIHATETVIREDRVPINSENFTLICDVTGPFEMIYWMKDGMRLNMTNSTAHSDMSYHIENNMLHFTPVTLYDDGMYQCVATNQAGPQESPQYMLLVNYGPLNVTISGPDSAKVGVTVSFTCFADSRPDCDFNWFFNNQLWTAVTAGPVITFPALKESEGTYICKARNPVTNITKYKTKDFTLSHASALHFPSHGGLMMMGLFAFFVPVLFT
ncbi:HEPACAM family member 2-like [Centropristis striata]|uniref:HEPACAM family member 2-like n=1 Tax=Centropristis striata TaxID=184440 RepID=UPI0027E01E4B|nr:HEPACAM family member 2-like [Centropristis striata]